MIWSIETEQIGIVWFGKEEGMMKDHFKGWIYKANKGKIKELIDKKIYLWRDEKKIKNFFKQFSKVSDVEGYWTHYIKIGNKKYWEFDKEEDEKWEYDEKRDKVSTDIYM